MSMIQSVLRVRGTRVYATFLVVILVLGCQVAMGFLGPTAFLSPLSSRTRRCSSYCPPLWNGFGVASNYSWTEEPLELDITVSVPPGTRAKDVEFKAKQTSIDLRLKGEDGMVLLDGSRHMRGRVSLDGTYWVISDNEDDPTKREITVTIEKNLRTPKDDFDIIEYDWKGVYPDDDEEVTERKYEDPEELNVREYAASLGVDIDNINMSKVDKTMFNSGLNMTRRTYDELTKAGYVQEVTQQADGKEFVTNDEGEAVPFSRLGDNIGDDEIQEAAAAKIPFLDTNSPWHKSVPVEDLNFDAEKLENNNATAAQPDVNSKSSEANTAETGVQIGDAPDDDAADRTQASDPIDTLTVKRLREVLRAEGLKVGGNKQELRERLRNHIQSMLQNNDDKDKSVEE